MRLNINCNGDSGKGGSIKVTSKSVDFLCDNPEHANFDDFYATQIHGKGD